MRFAEIFKTELFSKYWQKAGCYINEIYDIISVTDKTIEQKTGFKPAKIMQMIRELFNYTGMRVKKEYWDSYDYMNQSIVDRMA